MSHLAVHIWKIDGCEIFKAWIDWPFILILNARESLHIRLSKTEEDIEILIGFGPSARTKH
jgi:hypothetical protein